MKINASNLIILFLVNGDVRLINRDHGLLEYYYNQWGYVCDDGWNIEASNVACRSLGYRRATGFVGSQGHPHGNTFFNLDDIQCTGSESSLLECSFNSQHNCDNRSHVYLSCEVGKFSTIFCLQV